MSLHKQLRKGISMDLHSERGIALPVVIFTMVIIGAVVAGTFYLARQEARTGDNTMASVAAFEAAEAGVSQVIANWQPTSYNGIAPGSTVVLNTASLGGNATYTPTLSRLSPSLFLIRSAGRYQAGNSTPRSLREVGVLARLDKPVLNMTSAITVRVGLKISGSSQVSGIDSVPAGWDPDCPPPGPLAPGIRDSSGNVQTSGACSGGSCITGSPKIMTDTTITSNSFHQFGNVTFAQLAAGANKVITGTVNGLAPSVTNPPAPAVPACDYSVLNNWGDPLDPLGECYNYFPIIYAPGDVKLNGGVGQGMLLVGGNLDLTGGVEFYGPVIVQGTVKSTGTGGHINGGLMANNADLGVTLISGNSVVSFSSCSINRALTGASSVAPIEERSWSELY